VKFVLFVEGDTEKDVLPGFLKRCLEPELKPSVGIQSVNFHGWANLWRDVRQKAEFYLRGAGRSPDIIAVISLLDLYGPAIYPDHLKTAPERLTWAKAKVEKEVDHGRFRQYFAVHELEAWLLSQSGIFPKEVRSDIEALTTNPEVVNFVQPPKRKLDDIYEHRLQRGYQARTDGAKLFRALNPTTVKNKCPIFSLMIDELIALARNPRP